MITTLSTLLHKNSVAMMLNLGFAAIIGIVIPEFVVTWGGSIIWGGLGGVVRAVLEGKASNKPTIRATFEDGWHYILIGAVSAAALDHIHIPKVDEYISSFPVNAFDFLIGNFAVTAYDVGDTIIEMVPNLVPKFLRKKDDQKDD